MDGGWPDTKKLRAMSLLTREGSGGGTIEEGGREDPLDIAELPGRAPSDIESHKAPASEVDAE